MPPEPLDYASPLLVSRRPLVTPGVWLFLIASVFGSISSLYIGPRILFCIYGALLGVTVAFLDWALLRRLVRGRALTFLRIFLVVGVCIGVPLLSLPSDDECFKWAFNGPRPGGVQDLRVAKHFLGPSDAIILLRFKADQSTIDQLIQSRGLTGTDEKLRWLRSKEIDWPTFWKSAVGGLGRFGGEEWINAPLMTDPRLYQWNGKSDSHPSTTLIWDAATGEAWAIYSDG